MLGALRPADQSIDAWVTDARNAASRGMRVVLSGDFSDEFFILTALLDIAEKTEGARFALMLHWTQGLELFLSPDLTGLFDEVYVAVDQPLSKEKVVLISQRWNARWVVLPSIGVPWSKWIPETLFNGKRGSLIFLTPGGSFHQSGFLPPDELRLELDALAFHHPEIKVEPAPCEWFIPGELGPWRMRNREEAESRLALDRRRYPFYRFTAIVPFRWTGNKQDLDSLMKCLDSIVRAFPTPGECETIVAVDYESGFDEFEKNFVPGDLNDYAVIAVPRYAWSEDWRAGFIRNVGAAWASTVADSLEASTLLFIDSDVVISDPDLLRERVSAIDFDVLQLADRPEHIGFERATSMFIAVQNSFFLKLGGFADAFSSYGSEDNFFVWKSARLGARIRQIPKSCVRHLRELRDSDDLFLKMNRLGPSANLMYRMTLDAKVHRHFFVSAGPHIYVRGAVKTMSEFPLGRILLAPLVFFFTLIETDRPLAYLRGFSDVYIRRNYQFGTTKMADFSRRSFYYLRHQSREHLRRTYYQTRHLYAEFSRRYYYFLRHLCVEFYYFIRHHCRRVYFGARDQMLSVYYFCYNLYAVYSRKIFYFVRHCYRESARKTYYSTKRFRDLAADACQVQVPLFFGRLGGYYKIFYGRRMPQLIGVFHRLYGFLQWLFGKLLWTYGRLQWLSGQVRRGFGQVRRLIAYLHGQLPRVYGALHELFGKLQCLFGKLRWGVGWLYGKALGPFGKLRWGVGWLLGQFQQMYGEHIAANHWLLTEPSAWFSLKAPRFYKWVWRPILKVRYFLEYHLISRWRNS